MDNRNFDGILWSKRKDGYWFNTEFGLQHIYVWQQVHQATVDTPDDVIHHIDENRENNAIDNLRLMSRGDHTRLHMFGNKNCIGYEHSDETKLKMSEARTGDRNHMFGKRHSDETKIKIANYAVGNKNCVGRKLSDETKQKMSEARKRYWENKAKIS